MPYIILAPKDARITMTGDAERLFAPFSDSPHVPTMRRSQCISTHNEYSLSQQ